MGKKILFAVMALLVMATGKIWAEDTAEKKAYAILYQNTENAIGSLYFMYTNEDVTKTSKTTEIKNGGSSDGTTTIPLTYSKHWEVPTGEISDMSDNWIKNPDGITQVVFEESFNAVKVTNCSNWFDGLKNLTDITGIENLNTSAVKYMVWMFYGCSSLKSLDLSSFNTSEAVNTASMFRDCSSLEKITFGNNFKTSNTGSMFKGCKALTTLDLSSFNTSSVTHMDNMFEGCSSLTELDLSSFNTSSVTNMESMFYGCSSLKSLDLSSFNTSQVTNMSYMFNGCSNLTTLTLSSFDMSGVTNESNMSDMFYGCTKNNIKIKGNALVFVTSDAQKDMWNGITGVNLMVNENGTYKYDGEIAIDYSTGNETVPLVFSQDFTANSVTFTRKFAAGKPHTICLPFAITNTADYGTFYKLSSYDKDNRRVKFTKVDATEANKPYLFIPKTDGITTIKVTGGDADVAISSTTGGGYDNVWDNNKLIATFNGVYEKLTFTEESLKNSFYDFYGWTADGDFKKAGAGASVGPCRAYIRLHKETTGGNAPARLSVEFDDGETTGIGTAKSGANGGADAPMYNLQGQRVGSGYKGVVIKNGKKMIVR